MIFSWPFPIPVRNYKIRPKKEHFFFNLRQLRLKKYVTQSQLAADLSVSREFISMVENNHSQPSAMVLLALVRYFEVPVSELFVLGPEPTKPMSEAEKLDREIEAQMTKLYPNIDWHIPRDYSQYE